MISRMLIVFFFFSFTLLAHAKKEHDTKIHYALVDDPIDVVIVSHPKDKETLDLCIEGLRKNCREIRRVIVVSPIPLTDKAEWFSEDLFPFSKDRIAMKIARGDRRKSVEFFRGKHRSPGWYFQQLLKLYSSFIIPDLSSNVLVVDADTIFMNPVVFLNDAFGGLFCYGTKRVMPAYFEHAKKLLPGYERVYPDVYSVCHHMLFQRPILEDLFSVVEDYHKTSFWKAFCFCVDPEHNKGASEFEIYYNFALTRTNQVALRPLKWQNSPYFEKENSMKKKATNMSPFIRT